MLRYKKQQPEAARNQRTAKHVVVAVVGGSSHVPMNQHDAAALPVDVIKNLVYNQRISERVTFNLEYYHKNIFRKYQSSSNSSRRQQQLQQLQQLANSRRCQRQQKKQHVQQQQLLDLASEIGVKYSSLKISQIKQRNARKLMET